ncbi:MAG: C1 family peptidase [Chitinophagales bacterium]
MPIRMVDDDNQPQKQTKIPRGGGGSGGGGGLITAIIPLLFGLFRKNPKTGLILVIAIVAILYFFGGSIFNTGGGGLSDITNLFNTGASFDAAKYDATEIFEPPITDNAKDPLPESVSLLKYAPNRLNQGAQGSCVGWGSAYAARTILEAERTGKDPNNVAFSPAYLYNQIGLQDCQGAYIENAMDVLKNQGVVSLSEFPYTDENCSRLPNAAQKRDASNFKMTGFNRLTKGDAKGVGNEAIDLVAIKQNLAQGAPVVIGMMVGGSFMQSMMGQDVWKPTDNDLNMYGFGGHCMCVIGYDDYKEGGAFQIMNSWGPEWGKNGVAWVPYNVFEYFTKEAYGVYPMGNANKPLTNTLDITFGLINNVNGKAIALQQSGSNMFESKNTVAKGTKFKIEVTNNQECYTYIFGMETDNSSYVLFPYTEKHSPYCGITGTRLFPRDQSLMVDELGIMDYMAIVVSKQPLDYKDLNDAINKRSGNFNEKITAALGNTLHKNVRFIPGEKMHFTTELNGDDTVLMVIGIHK